VQQGYQILRTAVIRAAAVLATEAGFTLITGVRGSALPIVLSLLCYYAAKAPSVYIAKCSFSEHTHRIVHILNNKNFSF
jgi:hypothetical protein